MARYVFRLSVVGPTALTPAQIETVVGPVFRRFGFANEPPTITNIKGLAPAYPRLGSDDVATLRIDIPGQLEWDSGVGVAAPEATAVRAVRVLTEASVVINGSLPPDSASGRAGSAVLSSAVFAAVNSVLGPSGYFNLSGSGRAAGLVASSGSSSGALVALGLAMSAVVYYSRRSPAGGMSGYRAQKLRTLAQRYHRTGRHAKAKMLEQRANRLSR